MPGAPSPASGGASARCRAPHPHTTSCRSYWVTTARASGRSLTWWEYTTPRSRACSSPVPHAQLPRGNRSLAWPGSCRQARNIPGAPGCLPGLRLPLPRPGFGRGCSFPGRSSEEGGMDEFPLLRFKARSRRATCSRSAAIWSACSPSAPRSSPISSSCAAIRSSRAAHEPQSGAGSGRTAISHDHPQPAQRKQHDTPSRPARIPHRPGRADHHITNGGRECLPLGVSPM